MEDSGGWPWKTWLLETDIDNLSDVVSDILIAYEKGTSITETLKKEADMMRQLKILASKKKQEG